MALSEQTPCSLRGRRRIGFGGDRSSRGRVRRARSMRTYDAAVASARTILTDHADVEECIRFATLAASGHNTQPWRFQITDGRVEIRPDFARRTPVVDP